jgi:hypothetical protein
VLRFVLGRDLGGLQPLVFQGEDVYVLGRKESIPTAYLVTSLGVRHPLRRFCSAGKLIDHQDLLNRQPVECILKDALGKEVSHLGPEPLDYFLGHLVPAFLDRDWSTDSQLPTIPGRSVQFHDPAAVMKDIVLHLPNPPLLKPSLWVLGRIWILSEVAPVDGHVHVRCGKITLGPTGDYMPVKTLQTQWLKSMQELVSDAAAQIVQRHVPSTCGRKWSKEKEELTGKGFLRFGDLLLIEGTPPMIGHIIPPHHNSALGRLTGRDLAITAPLCLPPGIEGLSIACLDASGRWVPAKLPHGLCLGAKPSWDANQDPGMTLVAYLRWAAIRIAANRKFHQSDS